MELQTTTASAIAVPSAVWSDPGHTNRGELADIVRRRRRMRLARFLAAEAVAVAILVLSVMAGITERFAAETLTPIFRAVPIIAAAIAALLPILFFGDPKRKSGFK